VAALDADFRDREPLRQTLANRTPRYGNDDDRADALMVRTFDLLLEAIDGRPNTKGGAPPAGDAADDEPRVLRPPVRRHAGRPPRGNTAVRGDLAGAGGGPARTHGGAALGRQDGPRGHRRHPAQHEAHARARGRDAGVERLGHLVRGYFRLGGHHVQFNVVTAETLREAQAHPEQHRDLIVRVAGYSDYFCDLARDLQDEIIRRTEHGAG